ncbi:MAG TPA: hypothetical protein VHV82_05990 [Sporichthyaceae bacterium]|jgi:hypothetical protein|nr:hypothetical protein [Sporichthyaceae bacterium]
MSRVRRTVALAAAVLATGAGLLLGGRASADATYTGNAEAGGLRLIFTNQSIPLNISPQVQGPLASVTQNSLQQSDALAAFPYPGSDVAGLTGPVAGSTGLPLPAYPFVVGTSLGDEPQKLSYPGIELHAESAKTLTQADATGGLAGIGATSMARVLRDGDTISASAVTDADLIRLGDDLVVSGLHASAAAGRDAAGVLTRVSELSFSSLTAKGLTFTLPPPPGSTQPGQKVSAPAISLVDGKFRVLMPGQPANETEVPADQVEQALTRAGYPTTYERAKPTGDGVVGAGLQIRTTLPAPPQGTPGGLSGETPVALELGLVKAEIAYQAGAGPTVASTGVALPGLSAPPAPPVAPGASAVAGVPAVAAAGGAGTPMLLPQAAAGNPAWAGRTATVPTVDLADVAVVRSAPTDTADLGWVYSLVAAAGAAAFIGTVVLRYRGVR